MQMAAAHSNAPGASNPPLASHLVGTRTQRQTRQRSYVREPLGRLRRQRRLQLAAGTIEPQLMWIFGSPRSGSSWLLNLLNEHDRVVPVDEPLLGFYLSPFLSDIPGGSADKLDAQNFTLRKVQEGKRDQFFASEFEHVWLPSLALMMRRRFAAHALIYPAAVPLRETIVAVKEPNGSQSADMIMAALPRSRLLFLLRDGRDVVDSELAANRPGAWVSRDFPGVQGISDAAKLDFVTQSAHKWLWRTEAVQRAYAAHPGHKLLVRYEDLRREPARYLSQIFQWLGLDADPETVAAVTERHSFERVPAGHRGPDQFFRAATPGLWRANLTAREGDAVSEILGPKLRELGYET